jgi:hypothetical protein
VRYFLDRDRAGLEVSLLTMTLIAFSHAILDRDRAGLEVSLSMNDLTPFGN